MSPISWADEIAEFVHQRGALISVDCVAYAPHRAVDVQAWDVDFLAFSIYKVYGPLAAVLYGKYELMAELDNLYHYFYGKDKVPAKLEPGNANYEIAYSTTGIVDYLAALGELSGATGTTRAKIEKSDTMNLLCAWHQTWRVPAGCPPSASKLTAKIPVSCVRHWINTGSQSALVISTPADWLNIWD